MSSRPGRNEPCPCGSGKKFKKCCVDDAARSPTMGRVVNRVDLERIELARALHALDRELVDEVLAFGKTFEGFACPNAS